MCLKRYSFTENGNAIRLSTHIDIPTEIGLPYFISDDSMDEDGPIYGNFKLSLQSVVCHRGKSVHSGHYISLVKGTNASSKTESDSKMRSTSDTTQWMRFDDLAPERITLVDINQALKDETPYLLFYQILPIDDDPGSLIDGESLPLYAPSDAHDSGIGGASVDSLKVRGLSDEVLPPNRKGSEITAAPPTPQCPSPTDEQRRQSVTFSEPASQGEPAVSDTEPSQADSRPESIIGTSGSQSRSQSHSGEKFTISLPRITTRRSREVVLVLGNTAEVDFAAEESAEPLAAEDGRGKGFRRREGKREKSKGRLSRVSAKSGKVKGEKPDRECSVM